MSMIPPPGKATAIDRPRGRVGPWAGLAMLAVGLVLLGGAGADSILGGDGDDVVKGQGGNDRLCGGEGDNQIVGTAAEIDECFGDCFADFCPEI